ncbi:hypothetical protein D9613_010086 [Agrocybe pediades]|uniref:Domain of unknown function at the cortex 1 domain-containing protein n=1 Tax=Agrocybe pediades TaxID=84607 RepID=A0A8H4VSY1_9AGAR|nr:hypothetical protein D9613_010086 [Agrocybe pediades]KAF9567096.1 DUF1769-domain-containing protein [Agrocybe pediades]
MAPRLRVLAGTSPETMTPITDLVNTSKPYHISSSLFEGEVVAHIKGLTDEHGKVRDSDYFSREDRAGVTWSIQVQGRFLVPHSADDILFGNTFDRPLKLPWGTSAVLKFMNYIDPTLEHDLQSSTKPWALSPLISTMPHFMHKHGPQSGSNKKPPFPTHIEDSTSQLYLALADEACSAPRSDLLRAPSSGSSSSSSSDLSSGSVSSGSSHTSIHSKSSSGSRIKDTIRKVKRRKSRSTMDARRRKETELQSLDGAAQRRSYFSRKENRAEVIFGPDDLITTDFCYGFINFAPSLSLQLPGGLSFDLMKYWDGQPVRFVCCERIDNTMIDENHQTEPWGRIFWCVAIEIVDD